MRNPKTRSAVIFSLALVLLLVACQAPPAPAPAPVAPVETVVVEESRGVTRDLNVPGVLSAGDMVVRRTISLPPGSLPWTVFTGVAPDVTMTGAISMTGLLQADGGITVDDTNFTVSGTTGAVTTASSLGVAGAATMGGGYNSSGCTVSTAGAFSCDGAVKLDSTLGVTGTTSLAGMTTMKVSVLNKIANYPVTVADTGSVIQASGNITLTLPAAAAGLNYCIVNYGGGDLTLDVTDTADVFLNETNSPGDRVTNTTAYDSICLTAIDAINWVTLSSLGTWADGN